MKNLLGSLLGGVNVSKKEKDVRITAVEAKINAKFDTKIDTIENVTINVDGGLLKRLMEQMESAPAGTDDSEQPQNTK